ncbi:hypothetical protein ACHAXT_003329 [Thalassiosira profunda]
MGNSETKGPASPPTAEGAPGDDLEPTEHRRNPSAAAAPPIGGLLPPERRRWASDDLVARTDAAYDDNNGSSEDDETEVPRIIGCDHITNGEAGESASERRVNHRQASSVSVLTADGERDSLLTSRRSILKHSHYSTMASQGEAAAPAAAESDRRTSWNLNEGEEEESASFPNGSLRSMFSTLSGRRQSETTVVAPDDVSLPPRTLLLGSSKLNASIRIKELRAETMSVRSLGVGWSNEGESDEGGALGTARTLKEIETEYLAKTRTTFYNDAVNFAEGTIPQSIVIGLCIGTICGLVAYVYYSILDYLLEVFWERMPEHFVVDRWPEHLHWLWIPLVTFTLSLCCGLSIYVLGEPGDLAYTIQCVHEKGYKGTHHIIPMTVSSLFTILAGGSLGPEAPLVAICAATAGFISRRVFKQRNRNVVRKHTFMGMSGALAAFFGVPLGGSIFALEVTSRFGVEYFEHLVEAIFAGEVCVMVFRSIAGLPLGAIWQISPTALTETEPYLIALGAAIGLLGAGLAFVWANFHWRLLDVFRNLGLLDDENTLAVPRVMAGAVGIVAIGALVPHTLFWGEFEIQALATLSPASELPHVWPTSGLIDFEMDSCWNCIIVGFSKLMAISFTVAGGFRGGYIFPFFAAGAAFGRALCFVFPEVSPSIATLCFAAGVNVAITRTSVATSLILTALSGEQCALPAVLAASIVSLFATGYVPFIKSQIARSDIDFSLYYRHGQQPRLQDSFRSTDGTGKKPPSSLAINMNDEGMQAAAP